MGAVELTAEDKIRVLKLFELRTDTLESGDDDLDVTLIKKMKISDPTRAQSGGAHPPSGSTAKRRKRR